MAFGSNVFNALVPFYTNVEAAPAYLENTSERVTSESFYWANRIIAALADARFRDNSAHIERYTEKVGALGHQVLRETEAAVRDLAPEEAPRRARGGQHPHGGCPQGRDREAARKRALHHEPLDEERFCDVGQLTAGALERCRRGARPFPRFGGAIPLTHEPRRAEN